MAARPEALADEAAVLARAAAGDRRAFERIYRRYAPAIYSAVLVPMLGDADDAADCLRETFISAHGSLERVQWKPPGLWPYLATLARNKARDLLRASGRRQRLRGAFAEHLAALAPDPGDPTDAATTRGELRARIEEILGEMNPRYAKVLRLRLLEDRDRAECAELMGVKVGTLDVLLYRACRSFRSHFEARYPGEEGRT